MLLKTLRLENLRIVASAELQLGPGLNWLLGRNGAGKTSVLEAVGLLASGRSFRGGSVDGVIRKGCESATVFAEVVDQGSGSLNRIGLERRVRGFEARIDGEKLGSLADLFERCPAVCVEPDSGSLISGPGELRRRFLDWGLFHVEPGFLTAWRRFQRALKQRNRLLRTRRASAELDAWDQELAASGDRLHRLRRDYLLALGPSLLGSCVELLPDLGEPLVRYRPGWPAEDESLADCLARVRQSDLRQGFSSAGPQRAGWSIGFARLPTREQFSRGQTKLVALAAHLAQVAHFSDCRRQSPIVCLDDVMAELDPANQKRVLQRLLALGTQVLLSSVDSASSERNELPSTLFHVEQGRITRQV